VDNFVHNLAQADSKSHRMSLHESKNVDELLFALEGRVIKKAAQKLFEHLKLLERTQALPKLSIILNYG
jgi:hypothetical protein